MLGWFKRKLKKKDEQPVTADAVPEEQGDVLEELPLEDSSELISDNIVDTEDELSVEEDIENDVVEEPVQTVLESEYAEPEPEEAIL